MRIAAFLISWIALLGLALLLGVAGCDANPPFAGAYGGGGGNGASSGGGAGSSSGGAASSNGDSTSMGGGSGSSSGGGQTDPGGSGSGSSSGAATDDGGSVPVNPNALSFKTDIEPIMQSYCTECHEPGESIDLTQMPFNGSSSASVVSQMLSDIAANKMPPVPRDPVPASAVTQIQTWQSQGMNP